MMAFFQSHYEKIILACLLVIFAVLLVWQVNFLQAVQSQRVDAIINKEDPASDQTPFDFTQEKFRDTFIFSDFVQWHPEPKVNALPHPRTDLFSSFHLSACPFCFNLIPSSYFPEIGSTAVGRCPIADCGKELKARLKESDRRDLDIDFSVGGNNDRNSNGVPDSWEKENNVFAEDSSSIDEDPDGDHYTTYEEFVLKTDPMDPQSHPAYITYTTVKKLGRTKIADFSFKGLASSGVTDKSKMEFNIEYKEPGWKSSRVRPKKLGEEIKHKSWTFKIVDVIPDDETNPGRGTAIIVQRNGFDEKIRCDYNKPVYDPVETVELWNEPYQKNISCQVGKSFRLGDAKVGVEEYTVESATPHSAVVVNAKGEKLELKKYTKQPIVEKRRSGEENPDEPVPDYSGRDRGLQPLKVPSGSRKKSSRRRR